MAKSNFTVHDLVWAKMKGYPPWPAEIVPHPENSLSKKAQYYVYFFGSNLFGWISPQHIHHHDDSFVKKYSSMKRKPKNYERAISEIIDAHRDRYENWETDVNNLQNTNETGKHIPYGNENAAVKSLQLNKTPVSLSQMNEIQVKEIKVVLKRLNDNLISKYTKRKSDETDLLTNFFPNKKQKCISPNCAKKISKKETHTTCRNNYKVQKKLKKNALPDGVIPSNLNSEESDSELSHRSDVYLRYNGHEEQTQRCRKNRKMPLNRKKKTSHTRNKGKLLDKDFNHGIPHLQSSDAHSSVIQALSDTDTSSESGPGTSEADTYRPVHHSAVQGETYKRLNSLVTKNRNRLDTEDLSVEKKSSISSSPESIYDTENEDLPDLGSSVEDEIESGPGTSSEATYRPVHHDAVQGETYERLNSLVTKNRNRLDTEDLSVEENSTNSSSPESIYDTENEDLPDLGSSGEDEIESGPGTSSKATYRPVQGQAYKRLNSLVTKNRNRLDTEDLSVEEISTISSPEIFFDTENENLSDFSSSVEDESDIDPGVLFLPSDHADCPEDFCVDLTIRVPKLKSIIPTKKKIGFLGLGRIGQIIVNLLIESGHSVTIWNRTAITSDRFSKATKGKTPADVVQSCDIIFSCLSNSDASKSVFLRNDGVLCGLQSAQVDDNIKGIVELTSLDSETAKSFAEWVYARSGRFLEAPIHGTREEAKLGNLFIVAAGAKSLFDDCYSSFCAISKSAMFLSPTVGDASTYSIIRNMVSGSIYAVLAEAIALAQKTGIKKEMLINMLDSEPFLMKNANKFAYNVFDNISKHNSCTTECKSVNLPLRYLHSSISAALNMSNSVAQPMTVTAAVNEVYKCSKQHKYANHDVSAIFKLVSERQ